MYIASRQNRRVKEAVKLRQRRARERQGRFLIDGQREILRALAAGIEPLEAFVCEALCRSPEAAAIRTLLADTPADVATVTREVFEKLCFGDRLDGVLLVAATPARSLEQFDAPQEGLVLVVEGLEKPGNVGAVMRSADGAGVDGVIVADPCSDLFNPNVIRASLGALFALQVCYADSEEAARWLRSRQLPIVAARPAASLHYARYDYRRGAAIVLGSEAEGLSEAWKGEDVAEVCLPMRGVADSLNVSAAAAVLLYEAQRQRHT